MIQAIFTLPRLFPAILSVVGPDADNVAINVQSAPTPGVIIDENALRSVEPTDPPAIHAGGGSPSGDCFGPHPSSLCVVDLSDLFPTAGNQGAHSSCVAFAIGRHLRTFAARHDAQRLKLSGDRAVVYSAGYLYDVLVNDPIKTGDRSNRARCQVDLKIGPAVAYIADHGTLPEDEYDFDPGGPDSCKPHEPALAEEIRAKSSRLERDLTWHKDLRGAPFTDVLEVFQEHLRNYRPFLVIVKVNWDMFKPGSRPSLKEGVLPEAALDRFSRVSHALIIVGFDDTRGLLKVLNSAGPEWGDRGYAYVDYRQLYESLDTRAIYSLDGPKEIATRAFVDINVTVNPGSMTLDIGARGKFLDYVPPSAQLSVFASRMDCDAPSCRIPIAMHPVVPKESRAFTVKRFSVALDAQPLASLRNERVLVTSAIVFDGDQRTLEARIRREETHFEKRSIILP